MSLPKLKTLKMHVSSVSIISAGIHKATPSNNKQSFTTCWYCWRYIQLLVAVRSIFLDYINGILEANELNIEATKLLEEELKKWCVLLLSSHYQGQGGDPPLFLLKGFLFDPTAINQWSHTDINPPQSICSRNQQWRKWTGGEPRFSPNHAGDSMHGSQLWDAPGSNGIIIVPWWIFWMRPGSPLPQQGAKSRPFKKRDNAVDLLEEIRSISFVFFVCLYVSVYFAVNPQAEESTTCTAIRRGQLDWT